MIGLDNWFVWCIELDCSHQMNSLMFESFLHDDFVENSLDMGLGCYVRFGLWVVAVIGKFGCSCSWWMG